MQFFDHLMTSDEVAARLGVKPALMRTWRARGKGPNFHKLGQTVVYLPSDVTAWQNEQRQLQRERERKKRRIEELKAQLREESA